jgi:hypothetical protein
VDHLSEFHGRLLSKPVPVRWMGWETDTYKLQQNGWELSMDQDYCNERMRLAIRHREEGFIGQTNDIPMFYARPPHEMQIRDVPIWQMRHMGRTIMVQEHGPISAYANFKAGDACPRLSFDRVTSLADLVPFAGAPIVRTQALILPEATVDDLLKGILDRQHEAKLAYFEDLVAKEGQQRQTQKFHAQIISLSDYREAA